MIGPDLGVVELEWGGRQLALRFPLGAVRSLAQALSAPIEIDELPRLSKRLTLDTLHLWIWAASLHVQRHLPVEERMTQQAVKDWIDWSPSPAFPLVNAVYRAFTAGIYGTLPEPPAPADEEAEAARPKATSASDGHGRWRVASRFNSWASRLKRSGGHGTSPPSPSTPRLSVAEK